MSKLRTALIILNWNGKHLLERFLPGIIHHTPAKVEIIVADNASSDGSVPYLQEQYPAVRIIGLKKNYGFAGGYNRALQQLDADIFILLNSDMEVTERWVEPAIALLEEHKDVAALQPKIRSLANREYFEHAGAAGGFIDHMGYPFCRGRLFNTLEKDTGQYNDACEIFWASGAAMFIRADAFKKAGGFDERYFAHMEEIELCWRLQNMGRKIMYCPASVVYHLGGGSLPKENPRKTFYNFRNSLWMITRHLPAAHFYKLIIPRLLMDWLASLQFLLTGKCHDSMAVIKAHFAFALRLFALRKEGKTIRQQLPAIIYRRSIVWQYFVMGKRRFSDLHN